MSMTVAERQKRDEALIRKYRRKPWPARPQPDLVVKEIRYKRGFIVETFICDNLEYIGRPFKKFRNHPARFMVMRRAVTADGRRYIGEPSWAWKLFRLFGMTRVLTAPGGTTCCIGFRPGLLKNDTWFGWSHRAICGFKMGDKIFEARFGNEKTPFTKHGRKTIKTMADARLAATRFAKYVS